MGSPTSMPPLVDTNTSEPSSVVLTPNASLDKGGSAQVRGRAPTRLDLDLDASVRKLEESQRRREGGKSAEGSKEELQSIQGHGEMAKVKEKGKMPPPPLPVTIHAPTPPRMTRMPSLSQITSHLHLPVHSPATAQPISPTRAGPSPIHPIPSTSSLSAKVEAPTPITATHGFAMSPSGRLRLPASAMTRSRSGSGSNPSPLKSLGMMRSGSAHVQGQSGSGTLGASLSMSPSPSAPGSVVSGGSGSEGGSRGASPMPSPTSLPAKPVQACGNEKAIQEQIGARAASVPAPSGSLEMETKAKVQEAGSVAVGSKGKIDMNQPYKLKHSWTLYYDAKGYKPDLAQSAARDGGTGLGEYEQSLLQVGIIDTVQKFAQHMNALRAPSRLSNSANYHLFKTPIRPMWEDPANALGGKWVILFRSCPHLMDFAWANLSMGLIGEILDGDDRVSGIVASSRPKIDRIQVWTRGRVDVEGLNALGRRVWEGMGLQGETENISIEFQYNDSKEHPPAGAFFNVPFTARSFSSSSPATSTKLGSSNTLPTLNLPGPSGPLMGSMGNTSRPHSRVPSATSPAGPPGFSSSGSGGTSPKPNTPHLPHTTSPLQQSTRYDNSPSPSPNLASSPLLGGSGGKHALPKAPDMATIKTGYALSASNGGNGAKGSGATSPGLAGASGKLSLPPTPSLAVQHQSTAGMSASTGQGQGGLGMKRMGSGQGASAFAGPMGGSGLGLGLRGTGAR